VSGKRIFGLDISVGATVAGKYRIEHVLGKGGMGAVVAATHLGLDQTVAIKFLLAHLVENQEVVARFLREARAMVRLRSEHAARVSDVGTLEDGTPYMVMEYLEGSDLAAILTSARSFSVERAVEYVLQACDALADAHAQGIVHRDLKPCNLFLTTRSDGSPLVKVLDFGIAKVTDQVLTTQQVMGSPPYMSPEQLRSTRDVDARTDIWAIGIILYELVAGRVPFRGETSPATALAIATEEPPELIMPPDGTPPPEAFTAVVMRCLEKDPAGRYQSLAPLAVALAPFAPAGCRELIERIQRPRSRGPAPVVTPTDTKAETALAKPRTPPSSSVKSGTDLSHPSKWSTEAAPAKSPTNESLIKSAGELTAPPRRGLRFPVILGACVVAAAVTVAVVLGSQGGKAARTPAGPGPAEVASSAPPPAEVPPPEVAVKKPEAVPVSTAPLTTTPVSTPASVAVKKSPPPKRPPVKGPKGVPATAAPKSEPASRDRYDIFR
jgi:eukaryotic-like serine/threonine-protein kinase